MLNLQSVWRKLNILRLVLDGAICLADSFEVTMYNCKRLKAFRHEWTSLNRIAADKSHSVIVASGQFTRCNLVHTILLYYNAETKEIVYESVSLKGVVHNQSALKHGRRACNITRSENWYATGNFGQEQAFATRGNLLSATWNAPRSQQRQRTANLTTF